MKTNTEFNEMVERGDDGWSIERPRKGHLCVHYQSEVLFEIIKINFFLVYLFLFY